MPRSDDRSDANAATNSIYHSCSPTSVICHQFVVDFSRSSILNGPLEEFDTSVDVVSVGNQR